MNGLFTKILDNKAPCWLIVTHGVSEHHERHLFLKDLFGDQFNYLFYDLRGHGKSEGEPQYIDDFHQYAKDIKSLVEFLHEQYQMKEYVLYGHSLGGLITADFLKNIANTGKVTYPRMVYLSSPPITAGGVLGMIAKKAPMSLYQVLVKMPLSIRLKFLAENNLSHDQKINDEANADPYCCNGMHTKLSFEAMKTAREVFDGPLRPRCPAYVSVGTGDKIVSPYALIKYFTTVEKDFKLKIFKDAYHEIHHETDEYRLPYLNYLKSCFDQILDNL